MSRLSRITVRMLSIGSWLFLIGAVALAVLTVTLSFVNPFSPGSPVPSTARMSFSTPVAFYPSVVTSVNSETFGEGLVSSGAGELEFQMHPRIALWFVLFSQAIFVVPVWLFLRLLCGVFASIDRGDPFSDDIVKHVYWLGLGVVGYYGARALLGIAVWGWLQRDLTGDAVRLYPGGIEPIGLFVGLAIIVLAGVFRYGTQLRVEAELTV